MRVYFVRHGESVESQDGERHTPHTPLSETGVSQAESLANRFADLQVDLILSSHLKRAHQTAQSMSEKNSLEIKLDELLSERRREDPEEDFDVFKKRVVGFLESLSQETYENIVIVTHSDVIRLAASVAIFGDELTPQIYTQVKNKLKHKNTGVTVIEKDTNGWTLLTWNDHSHLS